MSTCEPCREITDCLQFPFVFYNINAGKRYTSEVLSYIFDCPDGSQRTIVLPAGTFVFTLPFPSDFTGPFPPLAFPCSAGGFIIKNIPSGATQAQIDALVADIFQECGLAVAQTQLNCAPRAIGNAQVVFDPGCAGGTTLTFSGTLPDWITIDAVNNLVIGAAGQFMSNSQESANATAQAALDGWATQQIALGNLTCAGGSSCIAPNGTIAMTPTPGFAPQLTISTDVGTNRMLAVTPGGLNGTLNIINTATNAIINTVALAGFDPAAGVYAASNQTFWISKLDGINNDAIRKYDKDGNFVAEITPNAGNANGLTLAYEPTTGKIWESPTDPTDFVVWDIDPATNVATRHVIAAGFGSPNIVYACPGFIFVAGLPPALDNDIITVFTVPGLVQVGTIDMSADGWDGGFAYSPDTGKVYFSTGAPELWEVNPATAAVDFVYTLTERMMSLAADPVGGRLLGISSITGIGTVVDPVARSIICTPLITTDASTFWDIAIDPNVAGRIYINNNSANQLLIYT